MDSDEQPAAKTARCEGNEDKEKTAVALLPETRTREMDLVSVSVRDATDLLSDLAKIVAGYSTEFIDEHIRKVTVTEPTGWVCHLYHNNGAPIAKTITDPENKQHGFGLYCGMSIIGIYNRDLWIRVYYSGQFQELDDTISKADGMSMTGLVRLSAAFAMMTNRDKAYRRLLPEHHDSINRITHRAIEEMSTRFSFRHRLIGW